MNRADNPGSPLWRVEQNRTLHNNFEVTLDHEIDGDQLQEAVRRAVTVFPVIACSIENRDGLCYFTENTNEIRVLKRDRSIIPGSDILGGHYFCVTYSGRTLRSVISHVITDGGGFIRFVRTVLCFYLSIHYGRTFDPSVAETTPLPEDELLGDFWELDYSDVEAVEEEQYDKVGYILPETIKGKLEGKMNIRSELTIPRDEFISYSKKNGTSPSVMMFILFAKAVYMNCEDAADVPVAGRITVDARRALGIPNTFMNCSLGGQLSVTKKDLDNRPKEELASALRAGLKRQISPEYLRAVARKVAADRSFPRDLKPTVSISYMGTIDFGEMSEYIENVDMYEGELHKLNAYAFKDSFRLIFHMGEGSARYAKSISELLRSEGISSSAGDNEVIPEETDS